MLETAAALPAVGRHTGSKYHHSPYIVPLDLQKAQSRSYDLLTLGPKVSIVYIYIYIKILGALGFKAQADK